MKPRPFARLLWRPAALVLPVTLLWISMWPLLPLLEAMDNPGAGATTDVIARSLWGFSTVVAAAAGGFLGFATRDVLDATFAWSVPSLRDRVLKGKLWFGLALSLLAPVLLWHFTRLVAPAMIANGLMWFGIGSLLSYRTRPLVLLRAAQLSVAAGAFGVEKLQHNFESWPLIASAFALAVVTLIARRELAADTARQRALLPPRSIAIALGRRAARADSRGEGTVERPWNRSPRTGSVIDWYLATKYETFGGKRFGWLGLLSLQIAFASGFTYIMGNPEMVALMAIIYFGALGCHLRDSLLYPISRSRRALAVFGFSLADNFLYCLIVSLALIALYSLGLPQPFADDTRIGSHPLMPVALTFAWAPVAQWGAARYPMKSWFEPKIGRAFFARFGLQLLCYFAVFLSLSLFSEWDAMNPVSFKIGAVLLLATTVQLTYWAALRRNFARRDLVAA